MSGLQDRLLLSRRRFLQGAAGAAAAHLAAPLAGALDSSAAGTLAYAGTYTGAAGNLGDGEGIYRLRMNEQTGVLSDCELVASTPSPSWIVVHPSRRFLYAANEIDTFRGKSGSISAFAIDAASGALRQLNVQSSEGAGPAYLSLDRSGKFAFAANYGGGSIAVFPVRADGSLGAAVDIHRDQGSLGAQRATDAPRGSFAISGHDAPHAHMILPDPANRFVLATDLGQDRIYVYQFAAARGALTPNPAQPFVTLPSGDGPRHFVFHPRGRWLYSIQEEASTVALFDYDARNGTLKARQTVSTLPEGFAGTGFASEILVSDDGRFVYAANRLHDSITVFAVGEDGDLQQKSQCSTHGDYPSQMRIDPTGNFLYACNRRSDDITCFRIDRKSGLLNFTGRYTAVGSPGSLTFLSQAR